MRCFVWDMANLLGHESLLDAKILHRDISIGNIMLKIGEDDGFLIDLDLAIRLDRQKASGAPSKTGTKVFMAIGTLYGDEDHSFMHDLESFFWVLFWICVHWNGPGLQKSKTEYESWNYEPTQKLAEIKKGKIDEDDKFTKEVSRNFTACCKALIPCIQELRKVVFPGGKRWLKEHRQLYTQMKSVLEQARKDLVTLV
jgi:serine/threonine protein kinase